jgi:hypothetical protein
MKSQEPQAEPSPVVEDQGLVQKLVRAGSALALAATLIAAQAAPSPAAEMVSCPPQTGATGAALCERLRVMNELCGEVEVEVRGHCQACALANNPLPCDSLTGEEMASCRRTRAVIDRCVLSGPERVESCLRRSLVGQARNPARPGVGP